MIELLEDLTPGHDFKWKKKTRSFLGRCCFHNDKNPSLSVYTDAKGKTRFKCFACGAGSNALDAVLLSNKGMTKADANRWLVSHGYMEQSEQDLKDETRNDALTAFYKWTNGLLINDPRAAGIRAYIASRGFRLKLIETAPIGYHPTLEEVELWLSDNHIPESVHDEILSEPKTKFISEGSLIFFYRLGYDRFARFKLRNLTMEREDLEAVRKAKPVKVGAGRPRTEKSIMWVGKPTKEQGFFSSFMTGSDSDISIVVEGEFDAMAVFSMCRDHNPQASDAIYCFGSGSTMGNGIDTIKGLGTEDVYTFPDNDAAGLEYACQIAETHPHTFIIIPPDYKEGDDPASWAANHEFLDLQETFRQRIPAFSWVGKKLAEEMVNGSVEEQSHVKEKVLSYAKKLSPTNREAFLKGYAPITGVSYESLCEEAQNNSLIRYRKVYSEENFGLQMGTLVKGETIWEPISNLFLEVLTDIVMDDGYWGEESRKFTLLVTMAKREVKVTVSPDDYSNEKKLLSILYNRVGSCVWIKPKCVPYVIEAAALLPSTTRQTTIETVHTYLGWLDDRFIMPNGYVDANGFNETNEVRVELPDNPSMFKKYKFAPPPADMTLIKDVIFNDILKVFDYSITLPAMAHMFLAPLTKFLVNEKPYCLWISGKTGSFKTAYTGVLASLFGDFRSADFETWRSTGNALERNGSRLKDVIYVVDDSIRVHLLVTT